MEENFTEEDLRYIEKRGNSLMKVRQQLFYFKNGIPMIDLVKPAIVGDGIMSLSQNEVEEYSIFFNNHKSNYTIEKFVPASGAASRMFKFLIEFLNEFDINTDTINSYINKKGNQDLSIFIFGLKNFPFYRELKGKTIELYPEFYSFFTDKKQYFLIKTLLSEEGLNFTQKPKGILPFHISDAKIITPIEENIIEANFYKKNDVKTKIHFTINEEFQNEFEAIVSQFKDFEIDYSYQNSNSDTIAVNPDNSLFRLEDNSLFFRPGGHGALIDNLNQLKSDFVFLKNIDNVSLNNRSLIVDYKKVLGAIIIKIQSRIFEYLNDLETKDLSEKDLDELILFTENELSFPLPEDFKYFKKSYKNEYLVKVLNRPIRVCGMVKNEGEPGGGPFWTKDQKGRQTLQIVESSQVDVLNENQINILKSATHFNPVDIVCAVYNYKGQKFNLVDFVDHNAAFITEKTKNGKPIRAFELPGLWNGAMAKWTTIFVEVPLETFNPVKTVNDLLKSAHQSLDE
ncbi:DUF4301 family protein [Flavobacterium sp.]|jgi:hypothetical protein|uniref:DUF4301 family protein n=1 Tax=Flavobacterium sp. TaxID=239 RepID=UPI002A7FF103|nr:DUF4301 family protein [Flavobacterium sp.]